MYEPNVLNGIISDNDLNHFKFSSTRNLKKKKCLKKNKKLVKKSTKGVTLARYFQKFLKEYFSVASHLIVSKSHRWHLKRQNLPQYYIYMTPDSRESCSI